MTHTPENEDAAHGLQPVPAETLAETSVVEAVSRRSAKDWLWFWILTGLWAMSFPLTRLAVQMTEPEKGLPVEVVVAGRMTIGAIVLLVATFLAGHRFPPLSDYRRWGVMALLGLIGMTLPFWLFTFAQKSIDSSLAALYTATAPLFVAVMAHFAFHDEKITRQKVAGLVVGFLGIALLFGPDAISNFGSAGVLAQFCCLVAVTGYALETVMARGAPPMTPLVLASGFVSFGAIYSWFGVINVDWTGHSPALSSWLAVVGLGIGPTALSALFYMALVKQTNATFLALTGYTIPVVSALIGYVAYGEVQPWHGFVAFGLILLGVWVSQSQGRKRKRPG
ncbi:MAG: hypothetical protein CMK09_03375 [Ponticaulis sp.]|nr:hypothetical protein [Ponticaulis sp.]|tara:strand:+ start:11736 stop:12746 length:1011 start_codon:yes stop_codon:yes gene_type:complete